jgi:carboxyl-terminal processing protease
MNSRLKYLVVTMSTCVVIVLLLGARHVTSASTDDEQYRHLAVYTEVLSRIKSDYVEEPDLKSVTLGALNGLLESIDPYASYLSADQYKQYLKSRGSKKGSVGLVLSKRLGYVGVVDALPGSPSAKAGLNTGDILESINNVSTRDMPLVYAEMLLEGDPGTTVEVGVLRFSKPEPTKITLTRAVVHDPPVAAKMLPDQIGLVQVPSLDAADLRDIRARVEELQKQGAKRLILDLRNDPTGTPESGIRLADLFLDNGLIAYAQGQKYPRQDFNAVATDTISKLPLVVITNRGTAGGAEVAAAALLDNKRAEVVGERTYGNAAVRKTLTMDDGSAVILSVAKFYSPSGKALQDTGVTPSVAVIDQQQAPAEPDDDSNQLEPAQPPAPSKGEDLLLKKAIEVVTKGAQQVASDSNAAGSPGGPAMTPLNIPAQPKP